MTGPRSLCPLAGQEPEAPDATPMANSFQAIPSVFLLVVAQRGRWVEKGERTNRSQQRGQKAGKRKDSGKSSREGVKEG